MVETNSTKMLVELSYQVAFDLQIQVIYIKALLLKIYIYAIDLFLYSFMHVNKNKVYKEDPRFVVGTVRMAR